MFAALRRGGDDVSTKPVSLGPWSGVDNIHSPDARTFQPPGELEKRLPALVTASDVDLDDDGWVASRPGAAAVLTPTAALRGFSALGLLLVHDEDKIVKVNLSATPVTTTTIVSGLAVDDPVQFLEHEGQVFWTTTSYAGRITDAGVAKNWGMLVPPAPGLAESGGSLTKGHYQVTATYVDGSGIESGAGVATKLITTGDASIAVYLTVNDPNATYIRVYATELDSDVFYHAVTVPVSEPFAVIDKTVELYPSLYQLRTHHMRGPIPGSGLFALNRTLFTFRGHWAFPSNEYSQHVFDPMHEVLYVAAPIRAAAGVSGGFWLATERGLFFLRGDSLKNLTVTRKDYEYYARGSLILPGGKLPSLGTGDMVALFLNQNGPVACTSDGQMLQLTDGRYRVGSVVEKRASWAYVERDDLRQVMFALSATTPEVDEFTDPSGSYSLVAEDEWTPILQRILDLEEAIPPPGNAIGDILIWDGTNWDAVDELPL
jgi:hypothetical protein